MRGNDLLSRSILCVLLAMAAPGCFVLNEIDNSAATLPGAGKAAPSASATAPAPPAARAAPKQVADSKPSAPGAASWWETARSLTSEDGNGDIVGCKIGSGVEFMTRDDCLARGGSGP